MTHHDTPTPPAPTARRSRPRRRSSRDRLEQVLDEAVALRTVPLANSRPSWTMAPPAPVPAVSFDLWVRHVAVARRRDAGEREHLVEEYAGLARATARRMFRHNEPVEDLEQVALEALVLAIDRFDPERRTPFVGFAMPTIVGSLKRHFRDIGWSIRVPRRVHQLSPAVKAAADLLEQDLGRPATPAEIADLVGVDELDIVEVERAESVRSVDTIDGPSWNAGREPQLGDAGYGRVEDRAALARAARELTEEQRLVLVRYYRDEATQAEIGREIGRSQVHVSRVLARALRLLGSEMAPALPDEVDEVDETGEPDSPGGTEADRRNGGGRTRHHGARGGRRVVGASPDG